METGKDIGLVNQQAHTLLTRSSLEITLRPCHETPPLSLFAQEKAPLT